MLKKILMGLAVILAAFLVFVATRPAHYHVERSVSISAPTEIVYAQLDDLRKWAAWSPWDKIDPNMKKTYSGPERGVGASYAWQGNSEVGSGKMTIASAEPDKHVAYKLEFFEPMAGTADATMNVEKQSEGVQRVTWGMDGECNFVSKLFGVFVSMDQMIGSQFESGLTQLKQIAEADAVKQRAAARTAEAPTAPAQPAGAGP